MTSTVKKTLSALLVLILALSALCVPASAAEEPTGSDLGDKLADFTFTTYDGQEYTLSETLQEKEMVLINIWATWCGPCRQEFPFMEEAYEQYKDKVEIFALSCEAEDTDDVLADFVAEMGLTFPVGRDTPGMADLFHVEGIPTSIVIDRFGTICFVEAGSQTSVGNFQRLFDTFLGEEYTESQLLDTLPPVKPTVEPADPADLAAALSGDDGGALTFGNVEDEYTWPVSVVTEGEDTYVTTTNAGLGNTVSTVNVYVEAKAGDALALDYKVSSESGYDFLTIMLDGDAVKYLSGDHDWAPFAYGFEADGTYTVSLCYEKDEASDAGEDAACFANVRLLSGDEAAQALAAMPVYPTADETAIFPASEDAREIVFDDPLQVLSGYPGAKFYIIPGDEAVFTATLAEGVDPDGASYYCYYDGSGDCLSTCLEEDGYTVTTGIDSMETTGYDYCYISLAPAPHEEPIYAFYFADEQNVNRFVDSNFRDENDEVAGSWAYADGSEPSTDELAYAAGEVPEGYSLYTLVFEDGDGAPVEGVIANVCDDNTCTPMTSDADGMISFVYPSFAYHIQVIKVPEGYSYDTTQESYLDEAGGETLFTLEAE